MISSLRSDEGGVAAVENLCIIRAKHLSNPKRATKNETLLWGELRKAADMNKFILMCVFFLSNLTAQASDLSLFAGWTDVGSLRTVAGQVNLSNFNVFGVRWEKDFFLILGFENTLSFSSGSVLARAGENNGGLNYNGNLVINLPVRRTLPYFTLGLGVLHRF